MPWPPRQLNFRWLSADLHYRGFSTPLSDPQHLRPDSFDYENVLAYAPWNPMQGKYTRYGPVEKLLARADDQLVVMATGDEITVRFDAARLPPLKPGWKRDFFLYTHGWAKDGEPNTAFAWTVQPLPFRKMANYPPGRARPRAFRRRLPPLPARVFDPSPDFADSAPRPRRRPGAVSGGSDSGSELVTRDSGLCGGRGNDSRRLAIGSEVSQHVVIGRRKRK